MNADKRRIFFVLGVLALIAVFVVGAIELATDKKPADKPAGQPVAQPTEQPATQPVVANDTDTGGSTSSTSTGPSQTQVQPTGGEALPSTGPSPFVSGLALSLLLISGGAYLRSRRHLLSSLRQPYS